MYICTYPHTGMYVHIHISIYIYIYSSIYIYTYTLPTSFGYRPPFITPVFFRISFKIRISITLTLYVYAHIHLAPLNFARVNATQLCMFKQTL